MPGKPDNYQLLQGPLTELMVTVYKIKGHPLARVEPRDYAGYAYYPEVTRRVGPLPFGIDFHFARKQEAVSFQISAGLRIPGLLERNPTIKKVKVFTCTPPYSSITIDRTDPKSLDQILEIGQILSGMARQLEEQAH